MTGRSRRADGLFVQERPEVVEVAELTGAVRAGLEVRGDPLEVELNVGDLIDGLAVGLIGDDRQGAVAGEQEVVVARRALGQRGVRMYPGSPASARSRKQVVKSWGS